MSTVKTDVITAVSTNGDLSLDGLGTGGVCIASTLKMTKGGDIASASPLVIDTDGNYFDVTGTTNFAAMTVESGNFFMLQFDGALTITHGSGIELPGAANLTTAAGDRLICYATAANTVEVMNVATEAAAGGGGAWNLIGTSVASSSASLTITGLDSTYDTYAIAISDFQGATDIQELRLRCGDSGGIGSGSGDYAYHLRELKVITSSTGSGGSSSSASFIKLAQNMGNLSTEGIGGMVYVHCPSDGAVRPIFTGEIYGMDNDGTGVFYVFGGDRTTNITFDRVQIYFAIGNIARGRLTVWGISHA